MTDDEAQSKGTCTDFFISYADKDQKWAERIAWHLEIETAKRKTSAMQSSLSSSPRMGAMVSLAGTALIVLGFFLPMFTQSNPQVPGSAHPVYEWQAVAFGPGLGVVFTTVAALPLLGMLIILATSVAALLRVPLPRLVWLKRVAAVWGLATQFFFEMVVFVLSLIGYARTDLAWGFAVVPIGFLVMLVGTWNLPLHPQRIFTPLACMLLAIGSGILGLEWLISGSFYRMSPFVFLWLPMLFLLGEFALLLARQWTAAALILPTVLIILYSLYFLTAFVIQDFIPGVAGMTFIVLLILVNGGVLWLTRRYLVN